MGNVLTGMTARFVTTATLFTAFAGLMTARAADSQMLGLVMPDAKVLAGVNVDQAKGTPFGLYLLNQVQSNNTQLQQLITLTGFDPTRDVHELLAASNSTATGATALGGLALARGNFDIAKITELAKSKGAILEAHGSVTIIEDPKQQGGLAFLDPTLVVAGDLANVKAAIDRPANGQTLPSMVVSLVNQWSGSEDAWLITTAGPSAFFPAAAAGSTQQPNPMAGVLTQIQQIAGGVKFGDSVVGKLAIQADNPTDATQLAGVLQFFLNMAQAQSSNNAQVSALASGVTISTQGNTVNVNVTLPQAVFQQLIQQQKGMVGAARQAK